jgi:hypothetical protein
MADIAAVLRLRCKHCGYDMPDDATVEAYQLHMQFEHDTDEVELDLAVICTCGSSMKFLRTRETATGFADRFECEFDGNRTTVRRGPGS